MIKNILPAICLLLCGFAGFGQFVPPGIVPEQNCHVNVNKFSDYRDDLKRAVFKFSTGTSSCSGTLINRATSSGEVGQYFITAWHCFKSGSNCGGSEFDFNNSFLTLVFNYQSPNDQDLVFEPNQKGHLYEIKRKARLVEKVACLEGDFALCEILGDPIPAYFNVYYAGWYPNELLTNANGQFSTFHHPGGSTKKVSAKDFMLPSTTPLKTTCITVTKVIDVLLGWIWKRKWSTQVICTYTEIPGGGTKYKITQYNYGVVEDGSSGGGLFTGQSGFAGENRLIGQLSATAPSHHCNPLIDVGISDFGKFANAYYRQSVKNTLNPGNDLWVDQAGIGGRDITCHPQITINGGPDDIHPVNIYPANVYQPQNAITLTAQTDFVTNDFVTIKNGADFTFRAGNEITLNNGFDVEPGATLVAEITPSPCGINTRQDVSSSGNAAEMKKAIQQLPVLKEKKFDISKYVPEIAKQQSSNAYTFNLYPNPTKGNINVELFLKNQEKNVLLDLYDLYGRHVYSKKYSNIFFIKESVNLPLKNGMYNMIIKTDHETFTKKIIVAQ